MIASEGDGRLGTCHTAAPAQAGCGVTLSATDAINCSTARGGRGTPHNQSPC
jgi:hypothetical protein